MAIGKQTQKNKEAAKKAASKKAVKKTVTRNPNYPREDYYEGKLTVDVPKTETYKAEIASSKPQANVEPWEVVNMLRRIEKLENQPGGTGEDKNMVKTVSEHPRNATSAFIQNKIEKPVKGYKAGLFPEIADGIWDLASKTEMVLLNIGKTLCNINLSAPLHPSVKKDNGDSIKNAGDQSIVQRFNYCTYKLEDNLTNLEEIDKYLKEMLCSQI